MTGDEPKRRVLAIVATGLVDVAAALLAEDPFADTWLVVEAEQLARAVTDERIQVALLGRLARALRPTDPGQADNLLSDAERTARSMTDRDSRAQALAHIAMAAAPGTPHAAKVFAEAQCLAQAIIDENLDTPPSASLAAALNRDMSPLADVAAALAAIDPDAAESIAQSITNTSLRVLTLVRIAAAL